MTVALTSDALTTLATLKEELGVTGDTLDDKLARLINAVSRRIRSYCRRTFHFESSIAEYVAGYGGTHLRVSRRPIVSVASVSYEGSAIDSGDYSVQADEGMLYFVGGCYWTAQLLKNSAYDPVPGSEKKGYLVTYDAGFYTPEQCRPRAITAFADAGGGQVTVTSAAHGLSDGDEVVIASSTNYNGTFTVANATTDTFEITDTWVADDGKGYWVRDGYVRTLPEDLEDACVLAAVSRYRAVGQDQRIKSEKSLNYSVTYADNGALLSPSVKEMLAPYREIL